MNSSIPACKKHNYGHGILQISFSFGLAFLMIALGGHYLASAGSNGGTATAFPHGDDDYVSIGNVLNMGVISFTIEGWIGINSGETSTMYLFGKGIQGTPGYGLYIQSGVLHGVIKDTDDVQHSTGVGTGLNDGNWHHIAGVFNREGNFTPYIDGVAYPATSISARKKSVNNSSNAYIGALTDSHGLFIGLIDEVRIWTTTRTTAEIQGNMFKSFTAGEIAAETALVGYWKMDPHVYGFSIKDSTSNENHGGLNGDATHTTGYAPVGDITVTNGTDVVGFWNVNHPENSGGMIISDTNFLKDGGDDIIFSHNAFSGTTVSDVPTTGAWSGAPDPKRWNRIWYCDMTDQNSDGGILNIAFDFDEAGMGSGSPPAAPTSNYRLLERTGTTGQFSDIATASEIDIASKMITFTGVSASTFCSYITLGTLDNSTSPTAISLQRFNTKIAKPTALQISAIILIVIAPMTVLSVYHHKKRK
jgi:hypothetical protein